MTGMEQLEDQVGVVTGLAWTEVGGELLTIEGVMMPGKGKMTVTGNLRDVMKESISAAASYVRSRAVDFGVEPPLFDRRDIHVHVPEGATPKDGPSAGVAMVTAIVSMMTATKASSSPEGAASPEAIGGNWEVDMDQAPVLEAAATWLMIDAYAFMRLGSVSLAESVTILP